MDSCARRWPAVLGLIDLSVSALRRALAGRGPWKLETIEHVALRLRRPLNRVDLIVELVTKTGFDRIRQRRDDRIYGVLEPRVALVLDDFANRFLRGLTRRQPHVLSVKKFFQSLRRRVF